MRFYLLLVIVSLAGCSTHAHNDEPWKQATEAYLKAPENLNDVAMYEPLEYSAPDTLAGDTAYAVLHLYKGLNIASREVRRRARVYFNRDWQVIGYEHVEYLDPMTKAQRKNRNEGED